MHAINLLKSPSNYFNNFKTPILRNFSFALVIISLIGLSYLLISKISNKIAKLEKDKIPNSETIKKIGNEVVFSKEKDFANAGKENQEIDPFEDVEQESLPVDNNNPSFEEIWKNSTENPFDPITEERNHTLWRVRHTGWNYINDIDAKYKNDPEVACMALKANNAIFLHIPDSLAKDKNFILTAIKYQTGIYNHLDNAFKRDRDILLAMIENDDIWQIREYLPPKEDRNFYLQAALRNCNFLSEAPHSKLVDNVDKQFILTIAELKGYPYVLPIKDELFKSDEDFFSIAVTQDELALKFADPTIRQNRNVVKKAVRHFGMALQFVDDSFKKDLEIVEIALRNNPKAIEFVDISLQEAMKDKYPQLIATDLAFAKALPKGVGSIIADYLYDPSMLTPRMVAKEGDNIILHHRNIYALMKTLIWLKDSNLIKKLTEISNHKLNYINLLEDTTDNPENNACKKIIKRLKIGKSSFRHRTVIPSAVKDYL